MPGLGINVIWQGRNLARLMEGLLTTIEISFTSVVLSVIFGLLLGLCRLSGNRGLRFASRIYLEFVRVIPVVVILYLLYYTASEEFRINLPTMLVAIVAFTLWGAGEMSDLVRGALTSIPAHQRESGLAVGLSSGQVYRHIIIPQAVRRLLPGVINLTTRMIKTTPLVYFINYPDLMKVGQQIVESSSMLGGNQLASFWIYGFLFFLYFIVCYPISLFSQYLERREKA